MFPVYPLISIIFTWPVYCAGDATIQLWNVTSGTHLKTLRGHTYDVSSLSFSPDSLCLASGSQDGTVWLWDVQTGKTHQNTHRTHVPALRV